MAWFTFTDVSNETFVIRLTGPADVAHARGLLDGTETGSPHIAGTVVKAAVPYNIGWSYHVEDISFFEVSTEVGDSTMRYIEKHLAQVGGALLPGNVWTGWSSRLVAELDAVNGSATSERLEASSGTDIAFGNAGDDAILGFAGDDYLVGGIGNDTLLGGTGNDRVAGGFGADRLQGGAGADVLAGGGGADHVYAGVDDNQDRVVYGSAAELLAVDQVFQFDFRNNAAELNWDRIDLRSIDADTGRNGDQAFRFVENFTPAGAGEADGQVRAVSVGANVRVEIDFDGDGGPDAFIVVRNVASLGQDDFFL